MGLHFLHRRRDATPSAALCALLALVAATVLGCAGAQTTAPPADPLAEARSLYRRGDLGGAAAALEPLGEPQGRAAESADRLEALLLLSRVRQSLGRYRTALESASEALALARDRDDLAAEAVALEQLGNLHLALSEPELAEEYLDDALGTAAGLEDARLLAAIQNDRANLESALGRDDRALEAYGESLRWAREAEAPEIAATAAANAASLLLAEGRLAETRALLEDSVSAAASVQDSHSKAYVMTAAGRTYRELGLLSEDPADGEMAVEVLSEAAGVAERIGDPRAASYAWGYLSEVLWDRGRLEESLQYARRAVLSAQRVNAPESLYRWEWQTGRVLRDEGRVDEALAAYRRAASTVQAIRQETSNCYGRPAASFRDYAAPLYQEFVDLLLTNSASTGAPADVQAALEEARNAVEMLRTFELQDYFQDDCVGAGRWSTLSLDDISPTAAVVYAVYLPDRLELLVSIAGELQRFPVAAEIEEINEEIWKFRRLLEKRTTREYLIPARRLYDWLIRPLEPSLSAGGVETLVFVPDGPLRTIPPAALQDGERFLVERYATAVTPGLDLTAPQPLDAEGLKVLAVGLTEAVAGFPPLPYVADEMETIEETYPTEVLLNGDFRAGDMERALGDEDFRVLHVASHAHFAPDLSGTFLLAYDGPFSLDRLEQGVGLLKLREEPLELLTLSACETAIGDDRAALGLAGVAVKAGARSALATLWSVQDQAAATLIGTFYEELRRPGVSRAAALQRAQGELLADPVHRHPAFWSPFVLINNWL